MTTGRIHYVGHATTLIELDGTRLLTDPVLRPRVAHIRRIGAEPDFDVAVDAVLLSHAHHDHVDLRSLKSLPVGPPVLAPPGVADLVGRRTGHNTIVTPPGTRVRVGNLDVVATEAVHDSRRLPLTKPLGAVGFMIEGTTRVYFAGDTDVFDGMRELATGIDVALLPIWGWGPKVGPGHMDPERAAQATALLRPRVAVPIHWGALAGPRVWWRADPAMPSREFERLVGIYAPQTAVRILEPGGDLDLPVKEL